MLRTQEIFVPERGILSDAHLLGVQHRPGQQQDIKVAHFDSPTESALKVCDQISMDPMRPREQRDASLGHDDKHDDRQRESPPLAYAIHDVESFADC
jgi:hypothetical protein